MAYTQQEMGLLIGAIAGLSQEVRDLLNNKSTPETLEAFGAIIAGQRRQGMTEAVTPLVTGNVTNWPMLQGVAQFADSASIVDTVKAFDAQLTAGNNANELIRTAVALGLAARKHFGL